MERPTTIGFNDPVSLKIEYMAGMRLEWATMTFYGIKMYNDAQDRKPSSCGTLN